MERERFEELVLRAIEDLPAEIADRMSNIEIEVRDYPSESELRGSKVGPGSTLLGLYVGIPLTKRGIWYNMALPDRVFVYQQPIERLARSEGDITRLVREVVVHEIGHHFGISDARLREIELEHRQKRSQRPPGGQASA